MIAEDDGGGGVLVDVGSDGFAKKIVRVAASS